VGVCVCVMWEWEGREVGSEGCVEDFWMRTSEWVPE